MLGQVCLLSVRLSAELTDVSLEVLGLLVFGNVFKKGCFVGETFVTTVTFEGLVSLMTSRVGLEVRQLRECFVTSLMPTLVGFVSSVSSNMLLEMRKLSKLPHADLAFIRLDAQVDPSMLRQIG